MRSEFTVLMACRKRLLILSFRAAWLWRPDHRSWNKTVVGVVRILQDPAGSWSTQIALVQWAFKCSHSEQDDWPSVLSRELSKSKCVWEIWHECMHIYIYREDMGGCGLLYVCWECRKKKKGFESEASSRCGPDSSHYWNFPGGIGEKPVRTAAPPRALGTLSTLRTLSPLSTHKSPGDKASHANTHTHTQKTSCAQRTCMQEHACASSWTQKHWMCTSSPAGLSKEQWKSKYKHTFMCVEVCMPYWTQSEQQQCQTKEMKYLSFTMQVYKKIANYWIIVM